MPEQTIFQTDYISITPTIARFGAASYQIANIGSVTVRAQRRFGSLTNLFGALGVISLASGVYMFVLEPYPWLKQYAIYPIGIAAVFLVCAIVAQSKWPAYDYTLFLKTSSSDLQVLGSRDRSLIMNTKGAIEYAFSLRS